jgi:plasmid maintenance system antidote protein VapI
MRKLETVDDILDAVKERNGWPTDYRMAKELGVPQSSVSNWRIGRRNLGDVHALKIADALEISPLQVIAIAAASRCKDAESRKRWREWGREVARMCAGPRPAFPTRS